MNKSLCYHFIIRYNFILIIVFCVILPIFNLIASKSLGSTATRIVPEHDLIYAGAFRVPLGGSGNQSWTFGGGALTFNPNGNSGSGSLLMTNYYQLVGEISIPNPTISSTISDLPIASNLRSFSDPTGGILPTGTGEDICALVGIQYLPKQGMQNNDKLYWVGQVYYLPEPERPTLGWSELSFLSPQGLWHIGTDISAFPSAQTSAYLLEIPNSWAAANAPGQLLGSGRFRNQSSVNGSFGPTLFASGPWNDGTPPSPGTFIKAKKLLGYDSSHYLDDFGNADIWNGAAWLTINQKSAFVLAGAKALRTMVNGLENYGESGPDDFGNKGWKGSPNYGALLFYDTDDLAAVANGIKQPYQPQPYTLLNVEQRLFNKRPHFPILGGVAYDRSRNMLYIVEMQADGVYDANPIIHVWRITDAQRSPDTIAPTAPSNLRLLRKTNNYIDLTWDISTDSVGPITYVVYRDTLVYDLEVPRIIHNAPCYMTRTNSFRDDKISFLKSTSYTYRIEARDGVNNKSPLSSPLTVRDPVPPNNLRF